MIVKIVERPEALRYDVYIFSDNESSTATVNQDGSLVWEPYEPGTVPNSWMVFDKYVYEALAKAMVGTAVDQDDAIRDARNIRDRLLKLIEAEWMAKVRDG